MQIKIDFQGMLKILRRGDYRYQICPFNTADQYCGDHCPLFSIYEEIQTDCAGENVFFRELRLCHSMYKLDAIEYEKQQMVLPFKSGAPG